MLYDTTTNTRCGPSLLPDGSVRCVPYGSYTTSYFATSTCTQTIDLVQITTGPSSCGSPVVPKYATKSITPRPAAALTYVRCT